MLDKRLLDLVTRFWMLIAPAIPPSNASSFIGRLAATAAAA
jgi:hypothetical protein